MLSVYLFVEVCDGASVFLSNAYSPLTLIGVRVCSTHWDAFATEYIAGHKYLNDVSPGDGAGAVVDFVLYLLEEEQLTYAAVRHHLTNLPESSQVSEIQLGWNQQNPARDS